MLRLNRIQLCESLQGMFRYKHVSITGIRYQFSICMINYFRSVMTHNSHPRQLRLLLLGVRINQSGEFQFTYLLFSIYKIANVSYQGASSTLFTRYRQTANQEWRKGHRTTFQPSSLSNAGNEFSKDVQ